MYTTANLDWLADLIPDYDLMYVDPLVCDRALYQSGGRKLPGGDKDESTTTAFLQDLSKAMGLNHRLDTSRSYLQPKGLGTRLKADRHRQQTVAQLIDAWVEASGSTSDRYLKASKLSDLRKRCPKGADDTPRWQSLTVVDAMFAARRGLPASFPDVAKSQEPHRDGTVRSMAAILTNCPAPVWEISDPYVELRMDRQAAVSWTQEFYDIMTIGWYPFARVLGLCDSGLSGQPYVDVLAVLMKPYPSLPEVLLRGHAKPRALSLVGFLERALKDSIDPEVSRLSTDLKARTRGRRKGPAAGGKKGGAGGSSTPRGGCPVFDKDKEVLTPLVILQLLCRLNRIDWHTLEARSGRASSDIRAYLDGLRQLQELLKNEAFQCSCQVTEIDLDLAKLFPPPGGGASE